MNESRTPESPEDQLPQEVVAALRERHGPRGRIPDSVDNAVLADAAAHLSTISRPIPGQTRSRRFVWVAWSTGTLAAAMLLFALLPPGQNENAPQSTFVASRMEEAELPSATPAVSNSDIDQNGQINILDAFALARTVNRGGDLRQWDQNGDGKTDKRDVDLVAMTAVML